MKKRILISLLTVVMIISMMIGASPAFAANDGVTLNLGIALADQEWDVMNHVFDMFYEKTGIRVKGIQIANEDIESKVESLALANKPEIDIVCPDNMLLAGLVSKGLVMDLTEYENLIPEMVPTGLYEEFKVDGRLYFMPFRPNVKMWFYDQTKMEQYGLELPQTYEDVYEVAKTFYENEGIARYGYMGKYGGATTVTLFEMIRANGGDPVVLNDEGSVAAFTLLQKLWPYTSPEVTTTSYAQTNQALADGSFYLADNWPYCSVVVVKDNGKTDIKAYVGPSGSAGISKVLGGNVAAIASNTEHFEESLQFVEFLMSKEVQEVFINEMGWISIREDAIGSAEEWYQEYLEVVMECMEYAQPRPILPYWSSVDKAINDAFLEIVVNQNPDIQGVLDAQHEAIETAKAASAS